MLRRLAAAALAGCAAGPALAQDAPPKLVVFITVDQLRTDYLERWGSQLTGGLARLWNGGAAFTDAHQDHAITETAPGHASTLSGRFPRSTGIVSNDYGVFPDPQTRLVGADSTGSSPFRFRGSALMDWLRVKDARSQALSVSRKDRGAILPMGRAHQQVFWYAPNGSFVTSTYYADTLPAWVRRFNARRLPQSYAGQSWDLLLPASQYPERDDVPVESGGRDYTFPHVVPADPAEAARLMPEFPFMDHITMELALAGLEELRLGTGPVTDVLAVSLSTTDAVGHRYGPDSREIHDQVLRLDRWLGAFLDSLYSVRDSQQVIVALTSDHGVNSFPEVRPGGAAAVAYHVNEDTVAAWLRNATARAGVGTASVRIDDGMLWLDPYAFARAGRDPRAFAREWVAFVRTVPGVERAAMLDELARGDTVNDAFARRWIHMVPRDLPYFAVVSLKPGHIWGRRTYAQHGSRHDYDTRVPVIFYGAPFRPGKYARFARVADIAPTLARVLRVSPTEPLDGRVLTEALR